MITTCDNSGSAIRIFLNVARGLSGKFLGDGGSCTKVSAWSWGFGKQSEPPYGVFNGLLWSKWGITRPGYVITKSKRLALQVGSVSLGADFLALKGGQYCQTWPGWTTECTVKPAERYIKIVLIVFLKKSFLGDKGPFLTQTWGIIITLDLF